MGGMVSRTVEVGTDTCFLGASQPGRSYVKSAAFAANTLSAVGGVSEQQVVTLTGSPGGGTFKLSYRGQQTSTIAFDAAASAVQTALRALSNVGATGLSVAGSNGGPWTVTFAGPLANTNVFMLQADATGLTGGTAPGVTVSQSVQGQTLDPRILVGSPNKPGTVVTKFTDIDGKEKIKEYTGAGSTAEVQALAITGTPTGGTFSLAYKGGVTAPIARNASAANVQDALNAVDEVAEDGGVTGSGGALPGTGVTITWNEGGSRPLISVVDPAFTGGTTPAAAVTQTTDGTDGGAIFGIIDGVEEFIVNTTAGDRDMAVYNKYLTIDGNKLKNYTTYRVAIDAWCERNFSSVELV